MRSNNGFTIVELLVVVTIIVILISLLVPSMEQAKAMAENTKCASNLHGAGRAQAQYLIDHRNRFPRLYTWNMLFGNKGDNTYGEHGYNTAEHWPLNRYLGVSGNDAIVRIAECPSDAGDSLNNKPNGYTAHGTSYLVPFHGNYFRVQKVYGYVHEAQNTSLRSTQIKRTVNKVLVADWIWHANRALADVRTQWHSTDKRLLNTLFADYHVELMDWINEDLEFPPERDLPPNQSYIFW